MAVSKICDRCGEFYRTYNEKEDEKNANGFMFLNLDKHEKYYANKAYDLCPACMDSLYEWWRVLR